MYYRLTYTGTSFKERKGDSILCENKPLNIGQGAACNMQLPESDVYEPQIYATILKQEEGEGWYLVRRTDCYHVQVNDREVPVACMLQSGDKLTFDDGTNHTELTFETLNDGQYDASRGLVYRKHGRDGFKMTLLAVLATLAVGISAVSLYRNEQKTSIRDIDLAPFNANVFRITVDSVYLLHDHTGSGREWETMEAIALDKVAVGTAFLTDSGLMVTARHCIEPWIDDTDWDGSLDSVSLSPEMQLALKAETGNRTEGAGHYVVRSHCIISKGLDRFERYSTDFAMNKSRDLILRLGTRRAPVWWRTMTPVANSRDMELGDFAYLKADSLAGRSCLSLAGEKDLAQLGNSGNGREIEVAGYPLLDDSRWEDVKVVPGSIMATDVQDGAERYSKGCIPLSADINRGNSGGPVLALIAGKVKVIGIVSKVDAHADEGVFWAVPATEILNLRAHRDTIKENNSKNRFRR